MNVFGDSSSVEQLLVVDHISARLASQSANKKFAAGLARRAMLTSPGSENTHGGAL